MSLFKPFVRYLGIILLVLLALVAAQTAGTRPAQAQVAPVDPGPSAVVSQTTVPATTPPSTKSNVTGPSGAQGAKGPQSNPGPTGSASSSDGTASINLDLGSAMNKPSQSLLLIILITVLSVAPALLIMLTSFTRIIIVLTLTRNALGVASIPPNQVLVGLALFLSTFIMAPTFTQMNKDAIQPYINGTIDQKHAYDAATKPLRAFMLKNTRKDELALFVTASNSHPDKPENVGLNALVPAFVLSEMKTAFIIGFVIFIPFLVIDIIVSSSLMSMGMMMLPPQMISLPFKLLLFVLVDGWALVVKSLLTSFQ